MDIIKSEDLILLIPIDKFSICLITGKTKEQIIKEFPRRQDGEYYLSKFENHLNKNCSISLKDYCKQYLQIEWRQCPTKKCDVGFKKTGKGLVLSKFAKGGMTKEYCPKFAEFCRQMSESRKGSGNPMSGKAAWNKGLNSEDPRVAAVAEKRRGTKTSDEAKKKQSISAKKRKIHGHTGKKHSEESIQKMREATAKSWAAGNFKRESSIHIKMREFLSTLELTENLEEEFQVKYFSLDFAFPDVKIGIEVQGQFFHVDPRVYPNGPICAIQRRNFGRDKVKKQYCCDRNGWVIIEVWEAEINDGTFKEQLKCRLQELNLLKV